VAIKYDEFKYLQMQADGRNLSNVCLVATCDINYQYYISMDK
jgi:hypothetical protein